MKGVVQANKKGGDIMLTVSEKQLKNDIFKHNTVKTQDAPNL